MKIAVIAGAPLDTWMGVDFLRGRGVEAFGYPAAATAEEQTVVMQMMSVEERTEAVKKIFETALADHMTGFFIYCNSLSSTVDLEALGRLYGVPVVTPLAVYRQLAGRYQRVMALTGNNQGAAGIERTMGAANPGCRVTGLGCLALVLAVEEGRAPEQIVADFGLAGLKGIYEGAACQCLILGCTHFPYFREALARRLFVPIVDPAEKMLELLIEQTKP